jgi:transposase, IS30 family
MVWKAYEKEIKTVPKEIATTLTYDQEQEMSDHKPFTLSPGMQGYVAHPGSPWERGTNENTLWTHPSVCPQGPDFRTVSTEEIQRVQRQLNQRPRKATNYLTPEEAIHKLVALETGD